MHSTDKVHITSALLSTAKRALQGWAVPTICAPAHPPATQNNCMDTLLTLQGGDASCLAFQSHCPAFRKHNQTLLVCLVFISFWLCPSSAKAPSFARHPWGGTRLFQLFQLFCTGQCPNSCAVCQHMCPSLGIRISFLSCCCQGCNSYKSLFPHLTLLKGLRSVFNKCLLWGDGCSLSWRHSTSGKLHLKLIYPPCSFPQCQNLSLAPAPSLKTDSTICTPELK